MKHPAVNAPIDNLIGGPKPEVPIPDLTNMRIPVSFTGLGPGVKDVHSFDTSKVYMIVMDNDIHVREMEEIGNILHMAGIAAMLVTAKVLKTVEGRAEIAKYLQEQARA